MTQQIKDTVNKTIRELMVREKLNTAMLADFAGIPSTTLYRWTGEGRTPSIVTMCRVARVLRVTLNGLIPTEVYR